MATYFVSKLGDDSAAGTSTSTSWLTVDKAASTAASGDIVYIAPGTYREQVTNDNSGNITYNPQIIHRIIFIGDTQLTQDWPSSIKGGVVRITAAAAGTELPGGTVKVWNMNSKNNISLWNVICDGSQGSIDSTTAGDSYGIAGGAARCNVHNCVGIGAKYGIAASVVIGSMGFSGYIGISATEAIDCVASAYLYSLYGWNSCFRNCVVFHGAYGISGGNSTGYGNRYINCLIAFSGNGILIDDQDDTIDSCVALMCSYGFRSWSTPGGTATDSKTINCMAILCGFGYSAQYAENCFVSQCWEAFASACTGPGGTAEISRGPVTSWSLKNYRMIIEAFKPMIAKGLMNQGSGFNRASDQISANNGQRDFVLPFSGSWGTYRSQANGKLGTVASNAGLFQNWGPDTGTSPGEDSLGADQNIQWDRDIQGRYKYNDNAANTGAGTAGAGDIGPWTFTTYSASYDDYQTTAPGINIAGRGEIPFNVAVPSGSTLTATVYAKTTDANYPPKLLLRIPSRESYMLSASMQFPIDGPLSGSVLSTAAGTSWANNTFQQLSVNIPSTSYDRRMELVVSASAGSAVTSSFSDFNITLG